MKRALFALLLAGPGALADEPVVREVDLALPPALRARLSGYVRIVAGAPWDDAAARRTVELLYATGEFEDVVVEKEIRPGGVVVRIKPVPSPRLREVRIEGDGAFAARKARRVARLRPSEPLWPRRLEQASRDLVVALQADGYLEAQVTAESRPHRDPFSGADLVFQVRSGPRARVRGVTLEGATGVERDLVADLARPRPGDPYVRARADKAAERMRKRLVGTGRWGATAAARDAYDPSAAAVDLVFDVAPGPVFTLETTGAEVSASLREDVEQILRDGGVKRDAEEAAGEKIEEALRQRGYRDARVRVREESRPGGAVVVCEVQPGPQATVGAVAVEGMEPPLPPLESREGEPLEERKIEADTRALVRSLEEAGHVDAAVEPVVPEGGGSLRVVYRARPGPRTLVESFTVDTPVALPEGERHELRTRAGQPYRLRDLAQDRNTLLSAYRDFGYPRVEVTPAVVFAEDRSAARVSLQVSVGPKVTVGSIVIAGLEHTRETVVRRELALAEGKPLGLGLLVESQKRLAALGLFERISISELSPDPDPEQSLVVAVEEGARTTFAFGIGSSEREILRGSVEVSRRNLGGMNRTFTAYARASFRGSRFLLGYREPYLFGNARDLYVAAFREEEARTGFSFTRTGVLGQTVTRFSPQLSLSVRYTFQDTSVYDLEVPVDEVDRQYRTYTLSGPSVSVVSDGRDDSLDPRRGHFLGADIQSSFHALGGASFVKGFFQASNYRPVSGRLTLAVSGRLGLARTFGKSEPVQLPLPERFFAGGDYGPRGFATDYAGPLTVGSSGELLPTGGNALVFGGVELRYAMMRSLSLAAFSDAGTVYSMVSDMDLSDVFYTTGLGLRYRTPVGPVRLDWGLKLNPRPGEPNYRFHITIGNAF